MNCDNPNWRDYFVSIILLIIFPFCLFQLKINVIPLLTSNTATAFYGIPCFIGLIVGIVISLFFNKIKKTIILLLLSILILTFWIIIPGDYKISSFLYLCGSICYISCFKKLAYMFVNRHPKDKK